LSQGKVHLLLFLSFGELPRGITGGNIQGSDCFLPTTLHKYYPTYLYFTFPLQQSHCKPETKPEREYLQLGQNHLLIHQTLEYASLKLMNDCFFTCITKGSNHLDYVTCLLLFIHVMKKWEMAWDSSEMRYLIIFFTKISGSNTNSLYLEWELGGDLPWGRLSHSFLLLSAPLLRHAGLPAASTRPRALDKWLEYSWEFRNSSGVSCHRPVFSKWKFVHL